VSGEHGNSRESPAGKASYLRSVARLADNRQLSRYKQFNAVQLISELNGDERQLNGPG
jgi:hypothetical protein